MSVCVRVCIREIIYMYMYLYKSFMRYSLIRGTAAAVLVMKTFFRRGGQGEMYVYTTKSRVRQRRRK